MNRTHVVLTASLLWIASTNALSAEVSTANLTLDPTYDAAGCALVTPNGYGGTDRQLFVPTVDGYYTVKDYSSNTTDALITVEAFDPNTELVEQALAGTKEDKLGMPSHTYLTSGTRVYVWAVYNGGYGTVNGCQADGATQTVTMRVVGEDSAPPSPPTNLSVTPISGGGVISFTPGSMNDSAITNYQYGIFDGERYNYVALNPADDASPITVTGLTNGQAVDMRLKAVNANGAGTDSQRITFTPGEQSNASTAQPVPAIPMGWLLLLSGVLAALGLRRL